MTKLTQQQEERQQLNKELRNFWYSTEQVSELKHHYIDGLKGVKVLNTITTSEALSKAAVAINSKDTDVVNFSYLLKSSEQDSHFVDITVAKDRDGELVVIANDSEGRPIPKGLTDALKKQFGENTLIVGGHGSQSSCREQQKNNIDCGPLSVENGVDTVKAVLKALKEGKSLKEEVGKDKDFFSKQLSIQGPENLTNVRAAHAGILSERGVTTKGVKIDKDDKLALDEEQHDPANPLAPMDYKRKKLLDEGFEPVATEGKEAQRKKPEKDRPFSIKNPADWVAGLINAIFSLDWLFGENKTSTQNSSFKGSNDYKDDFKKSEAEKAAKEAKKAELEKEDLGAEQNSGYDMPDQFGGAISSNLKKQAEKLGGPISTVQQPLSPPLSTHIDTLRQQPQQNNAPRR